MTLGELRLRLRERLDDNVAPYLWSDAELNSFLNQAVDEACVRARLIVDSTSAEVTPIAITAGVNQYPIHRSVFYIDRIYDTGSKCEVLKAGHDDLDERYPQWLDAEGSPAKFMLDLNFYHVPGDEEHTHKLTLFPKPDVDTTLQLTVFRLPLEPMASDGDTPELPSFFHPDLLHWACHLALLKQDADTDSASRSERYALKFETAFGPKPDASMVEFRRKKRPKRVIARWL